MEKILEEKEVLPPHDDPAIARVTQLLFEFSREALRIDSLDGIFRSTLARLGSFLRSPVGHVYFFDEKKNQLVSSGIWHLTDNTRFQVLRETTSSCRFSPGIGLPGQVLATREPGWIEEQRWEEVPTPTRSQRYLGIKGGFAFPIVVEQRVEAVFEFFLEKTLPITPELLEAVKVVGHILSAVMIQKKGETALRYSREEVDRANQAKDRFLAVMSHEFRTPMNGILGFSSLLLESALEPEQVHFLKVILNCGKTLLRNFDDVLDFVRMNGGERRSTPVNFDLRQEIEETIDSFALTAQEKGVGLFCDIDPQIPETVQGDREGTHRILSNFISNALKFTCLGHISVRVEVERVSLKNLFLTFSVSDTGIGISEQDIPRIFAPFTQIDSSPTRKFNGMGLGLSLSKKLVELMGGRIGVKSEPGKGTTFWFVAGFSASEECILQPLFNLRGKRILVADKEEEQRRILGKLLRSWNGSVSEAESGNMILKEMFACALARKPFDIIIIDVRLFDLENDWFLREIRRNGIPDLSIIALVPIGRLDCMEKLRKEGIQTILCKPLKIRQFGIAISKQFQ